MKGDDDDLLRLVATTKAAPRDDVGNESCASKPSNSLPLNKKGKGKCGFVVVWRAENARIGGGAREVMLIKDERMRRKERMR